MHTHFCRHCDRDVTPQRPGIAGVTRIGIVLIALTGVLGVLASSLIGPFIMFALPLLALIGFALGPLHWLASIPAVCGFCRREVRYRTREEARSAEPRRNREKARAAA